MDGRYTILGSIAKGGMATVYLGRVTGSAGFSRLVAIKRLHPDLAAAREFVAMLVDEARLASQIRHTNVVDTLDLVVADGAFSLVLEYVEGDSLSAILKRLRKSEEKVPLPIALSILYGVLRGLDCAHDARNDDGQPLGIVHRDVSPQNILVGVDGIPRVIDFGVAKAIGRLESTRPGEIRGKFSYMAPEQMQARPVTRQVDVYSAGVVLWELLTGEKLFDAEDSRVICAAVLRGDIKPPSSVNPEVPAELDAMVLRATARELGDRYLTARELLVEIEKLDRASDDEVGAWVRRLCAEQLAQRQRMIQTAPPAAEGQPIDELMAGLARESSPGQPESATRVLARPPTGPTFEPQVDTQVLVVPPNASNAGGGFEIGASDPPASSEMPASRRNAVVFGASLVAGLVLAGLFVRMRAGERSVIAPALASTTAASAATVLSPETAAPPPPSADVDPAASDSATAEAPEVIELPATPSSSASPARPVRRPPMPTPRQRDPKSWR